MPAERIKTRLIDVITYASDAGFYQLIPKAVVQPVNEDEVKQLFTLSHQYNIPLVFRAGGTSLSGQCITDGILIDLSKFWNKLAIEEQAARVRVQPGITGAMVNTYLKKHACKIGPDPSSISAAMMGGILSNNASGMCCGVRFNSYHTTKYIRFILPDGNMYSTEVEADYDRFITNNKTLAGELSNLRNEILNKIALRDKIRSKYQTKNTVGYSLNALVDYVRPLDMFAHLLIGAEGTLAFIAEAVMKTIPDLPYKSTALLYFTDIYAACKAIEPLIAAGAEMVELMDRASLRSVENVKGIDPVIKTLPEPVAALLAEFQEVDEALLNNRVDGFLNTAKDLSLLNKPAFTKDAAQREFYWKIRKGLFPAVGAVRASGTTVILEDVAFPLHLLGDAILDLQALFKQHQYNNAIIFGHAKDGNIHFVITQAFNTNDEVERYNRFIHDVVELVVKKYNGALKAEHGTGRNMAPFVETEWGGEAYTIMKRIKAAADPKNLLNPGVIINADKDVHIKNLKPLPPVEEEVDKCIECGYCEHKCPSRDLTMTPRRRIVARRALAQLKESNEASYKQLIKEYDYDGLETCAVDGLCATACPVDINTGDLVKRLRRENHSALQNKIALWVAKHFGFVERWVRLALQTGKGINKIAGKHSMHRITKLVKKIIPGMPLWSDYLDSPPSLKPLYASGLQSNAEKTIVYFPACISRVLGKGGGGKKSIMETFMSISEKAGINVIMLNNIAGACCGQIFSSKGFYPAYRYTANKIAERLWIDSKEGAYPVVMDVSSCTYTLHHIRGALTQNNRARYDKLTIIDSVDYLHDYILPAVLPVTRKNKIVLHPVCALEKLGIRHKFINVANAFASEVNVPVHAGCCGMAGDRGFLFPELTAAATAPEAEEIGRHEYDGYYSSTKTCEIAMSEAVKKNYESVLYLADACIS
ncbi:FAD-binding and (Fe-S)-binding domain-containing protein [Parafilimonas sp.]|uniref:FAD-binding and (Fe-S)-binding domain-containing protein n=1 Tax=Parafilimonas sp. TaxID=1969739 RepID=UPI0039E3B384